MSSLTSSLLTPSPSGAASTSRTSSSSAPAFSSSMASSTLPPSTSSFPTDDGGYVAPPPPVGGNTLANSAPLYLYTFLATLVLLLSVSAAIVVRSFIIRRRHRLMIEEAIRNGTWMPPAQQGTGGRSKPHVDLSKKPKLWDAYLGGGMATFTPMDAVRGGKVHYTGAWRMESEGKKEWDTIKPVYAAYITSPTTSTATAATPLYPVQDATNNNNSSPAPNASSSTSRRPLMQGFASRVIGVFNPTPDPTSPLPPNHHTHPNDNLTTTSQNQITTDYNNNEYAMTQIVSSSSNTSPPVVRVAVMIAMPSPPHHHRNASSAHSSSSRSSTPSGPTTHPVPTLTHPLQAFSPSADDEEAPLPHIELGVAEIEMSLVSADSSSNAGKSLRSSTTSGSEHLEVDIDSPTEEAQMRRANSRQ